MPQIYFLISHQLSFQCTVLLGHVAFLTLQLIANGLFVSPGRAAVDSSDDHHVAADVNHPALQYYNCHVAIIVQGVFFHWYPPKKYGKPRLGESTLT